MGGDHAMSPDWDAAWVLGGGYIRRVYESAFTWLQRSMSLTLCLFTPSPEGVFRTQQHLVPEQGLLAWSRVFFFFFFVVAVIFGFCFCMVLLSLVGTSSSHLVTLTCGTWQWPPRLCFSGKPSDAVCFQSLQELSARIYPFFPSFVLSVIFVCPSGQEGTFFFLFQFTRCLHIRTEPSGVRTKAQPQIWSLIQRHCGHTIVAYKTMELPPLILEHEGLTKFFTPVACQLFSDCCLPAISVYKMGNLCITSTLSMYNLSRASDEEADSSGLAKPAEENVVTVNTTCATSGQFYSCVGGYTSARVPLE